jgi:hypothetical protein
MAAAAAPTTRKQVRAIMVMAFDRLFSVYGRPDPRIGLIFPTTGEEIRLNRAADVTICIRRQVTD